MTASVECTTEDWPRLGSSDQEWTLEDSAANRAATQAMLDHARLAVDIVSYRLDPAVYDHDGICERLKRMVLERPRARVRVLVTDGEAATHRGHRLVDLAQRLSSFIEIRRPAREHQDFAEALLVVDRTGVIWRRVASRYEASAWFGAPARARDFADRFDEMWAPATPDPNFRRLHL